MISETKLSDYSRSELIYLARLYERAEKYQEMIQCITNFIKLNPKLNLDERNILSSGYKNLISSKRFSWRYLTNQHTKEEKVNKNKLAGNYVSEIKLRVENEINEICNEVNNLVDTYLIPNSDEMEYKIFYLKMRADYLRYICEFNRDNENFDQYLQSAEKSYKEAHELSEKNLHITNTTRLGVALNYSVLLFEIKGLRDEASTIAKLALDEALKNLDDLEKGKQKDAILITQLLMENLILWNSDEKEEGFND